MSVSAELLSLETWCIFMFYYMCHKMFEKLYSKVYSSIFKCSTRFINIMKNGVPVSQDLVIFLSGCIRKWMRHDWRSNTLSSVLLFLCEQGSHLFTVSCSGIKQISVESASGNTVVREGCDITDASWEASVSWWRRKVRGTGHRKIWILQTGNKVFTAKE